jgi:hypothetical protein
VTSTQVTTIVAAVNAISIPTGLRTVFNTATYVTGARVEARQLLGDLEAIAEGARIPPVAGTGTAHHPGQTAMVSSLRSTFPGARGRGRLYWPASGMILDGATLRVSSANVGTVLAAVDTYLSAIEAAVTASVGTVRLCVWSRTGNNVHQITRIMVGDVLDTQRRRRDALAETYQEVAYP